MIEATRIADSINDHGNRLLTIKGRVPETIWNEVLTHRVFCLGGDSSLEFDLPGGSVSSDRRSYRMTIKEFVEKWHVGSVIHRSSRYREYDLSVIDDNTIYSASELAKTIGMISASNIRTACRSEDLICENPIKDKREDYLIRGRSYKEYRCIKMGTRKCSLKSRLSQMFIRQLDMNTGLITNSVVSDCCFSGVKPVYTVAAGKFSVTASEDHLILTTDGWITLGNLVPSTHSVVVQRFGKLDEDRLDPTRLKKIGGEWRSRWQLQVRKSLLLRQNGLCTCCNKILGDSSSFEVHHIIPVWQDQDKTFDIENVELVHHECHKDKHRHQGWQGGTYLYGDSVIVDSVVFRGIEETFDLTIAGEFSNYLANDIVVHNSRNSSSSRAVPTSKWIAEARDPALRVTPMRWGANQRGMQQGDELSGDTLADCQREWSSAANDAAYHAERITSRGAHKELANQILKPYVHANVVITATEWMNFFGLRLDSAAKIEIRTFAEQVWRIWNESVPTLLRPGEWHLPFVKEEDIQDIRNLHDYDCKGSLTPTGDINEVVKMALKVSIARCARVSYESHETGSRSTIEADVKLHDFLLTNRHLSPFEHQATPDIQNIDCPTCGQESWQHIQEHGNFIGFRQYRKMIPGEDVAPLPEEYRKGHSYMSESG